MGRHIANAFLGVIGGYLGVLIAGGFYEITWGGGFLGVWIFRKTFLWLSDYFIIVPIAGGLLGGAASDKSWGALGGGFFLAVVGFYLYIFMLGGRF
jgi:hypothetical protein